MRKGRIAIAAVAATVVAGGIVASSVGARPEARTAQRGVEGNFSLIQMVHTRSSSFGNLANVNAWDGRARAGTTYQYRGIPCTGNAPVNNIASDLPSYSTRVPGSRSPSSMRAHPFKFRMRKTKRGLWEMRGRIVLVVCKLGPGPVAAPDPVPDTSKPRIYVDFRARFGKVTSELARWAGVFKLSGGTQRYRHLRGFGSIAGYFFCFAPEGCREHDGKLLDGQFVMHGEYRDPTPRIPTTR